jgi:hypothetical protein
VVKKQPDRLLPYLPPHARAAARARSEKTSD